MVRSVESAGCIAVPRHGIQGLVPIVGVVMGTSAQLGYAAVVARETPEARRMQGRSEMELGGSNPDLLDAELGYRRMICRFPGFSHSWRFGA